MKPCKKNDIGAIICKECNGSGTILLKYSEFAPTATAGCFTCSDSRFKKGTGYVIEEKEYDNQTSKS